MFPLLFLVSIIANDEARRNVSFTPPVRACLRQVPRNEIALANIGTLPSETSVFITGPRAARGPVSPRPHSPLVFGDWCFPSDGCKVVSHCGFNVPLWSLEDFSFLPNIYIHYDVLFHVTMFSFCRFSDLLTDLRAIWTRRVGREHGIFSNPCGCLFGFVHCVSESLKLCL